MKDKKLLWWILLIIIFVFVAYILYENCNQVEGFTFEGIENGPKVLIVGGTHGNEPSGSKALHNLKYDLRVGDVKIKRGSLTMIPDVNWCGLKAGIRWNPGNILSLDINRSYPTFQHENGKCYISRKIKELVDDSDFVLDLHEGYDFYHNSPKSIGSTISPGPTKLSESISEDMKTQVDKKISEEKKKFHIIKFDKKDIIRGTLSEYCRGIDKDYILIETTGQNNIQPLNIRVDQMEDVIYILLKDLNMI